MYLQRALFVVAAASGLMTAVAAADSTRDQVCTSYVSPENAQVGVAAFHDPKCLDDLSSVGCFETTCRFCRSGSSKTEQSKFFKPCDPTERAQEDQAFEGAAACTVSPGDQAAGVSAFYDVTCPSGNGGLGCQADKCRFCKMWNTPASQGYASCPTASAGAAPAPVAAAAAVTAPASAPVSESDSCSNAVATSGMTAVSFVTEPQCNNANPRFTGCVPNTKCQLCRSGKNEANQYLVSCKVLQDSKKDESLLAFSSIDGVQQLSTSLAGVSSESSSAEGTDPTPLVASLVGAAAVAALAVVAIWKTKKTQKARDFRGPCTPLNGSLMSLETCVSNL